MKGLFSILSSTALATAAVSSGQPDVVLVTFDGTVGTTFKWEDLNDPVMGGRTVSTLTYGNGTAVFNGTCAIVPSLKAPGFAKIATKSKSTFHDASLALSGSMQLKVRSSTPTYGGFRVAFASPGIPRSSIFAGGSFKAHFSLADTEDWQVVDVPFDTFSYDWSPFTGRCDTKDPTGTQHHCCTSNSTKYCPTKGFLGSIDSMEVWAEGVEGDFHIELEWIGASTKADRVCKDTEYCCPDAKKCLTPTKTSCASDANACSDGQVCCPLTKLCVVPGVDCAQTSECKSTEYCCPDAKACLTPTHPGVFCGKSDDACADGEICCPLTSICVKASNPCHPE